MKKKHMEELVMDVEETADEVEPKTKLRSRRKKKDTSKLETLEPQDTPAEKDTRTQTLLNKRATMMALQSKQNRRSTSEEKHKSTDLIIKLNVGDIQMSISAADVKKLET